MSKPLIGVVLGAVLGAVDGLTAWFTPEVRNELGGIVISSTVKGIIAGVAIGFFARKFHSLPLGILFGLFVGAILAYLTALMVGDHYFQIILPGTLVGLIVGFATQKYGSTPAIAQ
jgi:F0F1-type ATP synthase assembly protein I